MKISNKALKDITNNIMNILQISLGLGLGLGYKLIMGTKNDSSIGSLIISSKST